MLPLDQLIFEPTLTYSSPPFQSESKQANDMPNQPMHHRLGSSSSMSQSFLLTPSHITVWKVIARSKDEEISANWLQRSCNIHISTPLKRTSKHRPSTSQLAATPPCICTQPSTFFAPANTRYISSQRLLCSVLWSDVRMLLTEPNFPRAKSVFLNRIVTGNFCCGTRRHQKHHGKNQELIQNSCWNQGPGGRQLLPVKTESGMIM